MMSNKNEALSVALLSATVVSAGTAYKFAKDASFASKSANDAKLHLTYLDHNIKNLCFELGKDQVLNPQSNINPKQMHQLKDVSNALTNNRTQFKDIQRQCATDLSKLETGIKTLGEEYHSKDWRSQEIQMLDNMDKYVPKKISDVMQTINQIKSHVANGTEVEIQSAMSKMRTLVSSCIYNITQSEPEFTTNVRQQISAIGKEVDTKISVANMLNHYEAPLAYVKTQLLSIAGFEGEKLRYQTLVEQYSRTLERSTFGKRVMVAVAFVTTLWAGISAFVPSK